MLWQTDASKFEWFGKGKGYATLHAYIDDATGRVVGAWFTKNESTAGYVTALGIGLEHYGLPMEIYSDRHTIFRSPQELSEEEKEEGKQRPLSNFGQGLKELGVGQIFALTPEAKGRVERLRQSPKGVEHHAGQTARRCPRGCRISPSSCSTEKEHGISRTGQHRSRTRENALKFPCQQPLEVFNPHSRPQWASRETA